MTGSSFLHGKRVVITGGTSGIGEAVAARFARAGARVLITGSAEASVAAALERAGTSIDGIRCDLRSTDDIDALAARARESFGGVDILFANAGIAHFASLAEMDEARFDEIMGVNVKGLYFSIQRIAPLMGDGGVIVATGSIAPRKGQPGLAAYGGSKGAVRAIVRNLAAELLPRGIRVNCLAPGPTRTAIFERMSGGDPELARATLERVSSNVPQGRVGTVEEMAEAVEFLCGPGAAFMVGSELTLDGGKAEL